MSRAHGPAGTEVLDARYGAALEPIWLWDHRRHRIAWANDAGLAFWGASSLFDLIEYTFTTESDAAHLAAHDGTEANATLAPLGKAAVVSARLEHFDIAPDARATLVTIVEMHEPSADGATTRKLALFEAAPVALLLARPTGEILQDNDTARIIAKELPHDLLKTVCRQAIVDGTSNRVASASVGGKKQTYRISARRLADPQTRTPAALVRLDDITERLGLEMLLRARLARQMAEFEKTQADSQALVQQRHTDIEAERVRLEKEREDIEARNKTKTDFIAKLVHEMRNPLNAIVGFSEIMQQARFGPLGDKRYEGYIDDIRMSAGHLMSLVNDMLDLAAIEAGKFRIHFDTVALARVIDECLRLLKPQAADLGIELKSAVPANLPAVAADERALRQIMLNLISNAVKFTPQGGEVSVSATLTGDGGVKVAVRDTGIGMTRSEIELALEPFGQVDSALQRERKGTGLGLPLAKALAEANKAEFNISSEPNHGTTAELVFPPARVLAG